MRRFLLLIVLACSFVAGSYAQGPRVVVLDPKFKVGDVLRLELTKEKTSIEGESKPVKGAGRSTLSIRVEEISQSGAVVSLTYGDAVEFFGAADAGAASKEYAEELMRIFTQTPTLVQLDESYVPIAIRNMDQLRAQVATMLDSMEKRGVLKEPAREAVRKLFLDDTMITQMMLRHVQPVFELMGASVTLGEFGPDVSEMQNPLGQGTLRTTVTSRAAFADASEKSLRLQVEEKFDRSSIPQLIESLAKRMGRELTETQRSELQEDMKRFDLVRTFIYEVSVPDGLPERISMTTDVTTGTKKQQTVETIRRLR